MHILFILTIPLLLATTAFFIRQKGFGIINAAGYLAVLCASVLLFKGLLQPEAAYSALGFIRLDALSAFFILVVATVAFAAALYSIGYIRRDREEGKLTERKAKIYYALFNLFCLAMFLVPSVNNLGMMWVAIEMTTLISAFLVGFYNSKESVEAAWKYIIICSVGIIFALLGTILFSYAFSSSGLTKSLNWSDMAPVAHILDKNILKVAFIFILVGYGTKAGLAPMHTWLPDAHSQAIAPISALLSGVLLKTALYAIIRFGIITVNGVGFHYVGSLLVLLGVLSLAISCGFILVQKDLKRLLAYSSIEHIGIISIGLGAGAPLATAGALLHIFNHAVTKSFMFFGAGTIVATYKKHRMSLIRGAIRALPFTGAMVLIGVFALTGFPPFSIFVSEMMIIISLFTNAHYKAAACVLLLLAVIFGSFIHHFSRMLFGNLPKEMEPRQEPLSGKCAFLFLLSAMFVSTCAFVFLKKDFLCLAQRLFQR